MSVLPGFWSSSLKHCYNSNIWDYYSFLTHQVCGSNPGRFGDWSHSWHSAGRTWRCSGTSASICSSHVGKTLWIGILGGVPFFQGLNSASSSIGASWTLLWGPALVPLHLLCILGWGSQGALHVCKASYHRQLLTLTLLKWRGVYTKPPSFSSPWISGFLCAYLHVTAWCFLTAGE